MKHLVMLFCSLVTVLGLQAQFSITYIPDTCSGNVIPMPYSTQANSLHAKYSVDVPDVYEGYIVIQTLVNGNVRTSNSISGDGIYQITIPNASQNGSQSVNLDAQLLHFFPGGPFNGALMDQATVYAVTMIWDSPLVELLEPEVQNINDSTLITVGAEVEWYGFGEGAISCYTHRTFVHCTVKRMSDDSTLFTEKRDQATGTNGFHTWSWTVQNNQTSEPVCVDIHVTREDTSSVPNFEPQEIELQSGSNSVMCDVSLSSLSTVVAPKESLEVISVAPNPFEDRLAVTSAKSSTYVVYSQSGSVVDQGNLRNGVTFLGTETWSPGFYYLRTVDGSTAKLVRK